MEPRPKDKMPPNQLKPIVRAVVYTALAEWGRDIHMAPGHDVIDAAAFIADRLCETIDQDGWDHSDRVRRAGTKLTWGCDTDG